MHTSYMNFCSGHPSKGAGGSPGQGVFLGAAGSIVTPPEAVLSLSASLLGSGHSLFSSEDA